MSLPWHVHPEVWVLVAVAVAGYLYADRALRPSDAAGATRRQRIWFFTGVAVIFLAASWPIHDIAEDYLYSVHMIQHMLISMVAPPLLMMGTPEWIWKAIAGRGARLRVSRFITRAIPALIISNTVLALTHMPTVVNTSATVEWFHFAVHLTVFVSSVIMWAPVLSPLISVPALSNPAKMMYLFLQSLIPTVPASFLTFGSTVLYRHYELAPRLTSMSALTDQLVAGLIMKLGGGFLLWGVITAIFFRWYNREHNTGWDEMQMRDVDARISRSLSKGTIS